MCTPSEGQYKLLEIVNNYKDYIATFLILKVYRNCNTDMALVACKFSNRLCRLNLDFLATVHRVFVTVSEV